MDKARLFLELLTDLFPPPEGQFHTLYFRDGRLRLSFFLTGVEYRLYFEASDFDRPITSLIDNVINEVKPAAVLPRCEDCGWVTKALGGKPDIYVCQNVGCGRLHTK